MIVVRYPVLVTFPSERGWRVDSGSASPVPGPDQDPGFPPLESLAADPAGWEAWLALGLEEDEPPGDDDEEYLDPQGSVLPPDEDLAVIEAEAGRFAAELNRPGFCGGSQSTGEWDDGSSTEVSGRAA